jgi:hypothetical protein
MPLKLMDEQVHMNWEIICQILLEDFGRQKICAKFVLQAV